MKSIPIKKRWGQNFINDKNLIDKIISVFDPNKRDTVLEIGPGKGALTYPLSKRVKKIIAVEIDPILVSHLKENFIENIELVNDDILRYFY